MLYTVRDISHYNTIGNYPEFCKHTTRVQIKISEGLSIGDGLAATHHAGTAGLQRAPYHFARPVDYRTQISNFLSRKKNIGEWEGPDMLDCEFEGIYPEFIRTLVAEYRKQSDIKTVQVYIGLSNIKNNCPIDLWWDPDIFIQVARYRKTDTNAGDPDKWKLDFGFDHEGITSYQWDNTWPFYPNGPRGDISYDRIPIVGGNIMSGEADALIKAVSDRLMQIKAATDRGELKVENTKYVIAPKNLPDVVIDALGAAQQANDRVKVLSDQVTELLARPTGTLPTAAEIASEIIKQLKG